MALALSALAFFQTERAADAQAIPSPAPTATPAARQAFANSTNPFTVRGYVRAYDFTRQNASGFPSTAGTLNQQSLSLATSLHLEYRIFDSGFSLGGSYLYANPLNGCDNAASIKTVPNCQVLGTQNVATSSNLQHLNPDNTLPGYGMSTFYEAYVQYNKKGFFARVGDQVINTPWTNASDSRLKPAAFQGADVSYKLGPRFSMEAMDMDRYQPRTTNDFVQANLLTGAANELPYGNAPITNPAANTGGFHYSRIGYAAPNFTSNLHYYHFDDLANFVWLDGRYAFSRARFAPYIAIQAGDERNTGSSIVGQINSQVYGTQLGVNITKNVLLTVGADVIPRKIQNLPAGQVCTAATGQIKQSQTYPNPGAGFFVPTAAPQCIANPNGTFSVEYGGLASPYTDSYATDPLFTTSLTQGMVDRRAPGSSEKVALTYTSTNKRLVMSVSQAWYDYGFTGFPDQTAEANADAMYYFRPMAPGPYHGLLLRYRYGVRTDDHSSALNYPGIPGVYFGQSPYFVYNRAQLEYDF
jgi:outer membrane porin, OprD family